MARPIRATSPGFISMSRTSPLRLLSRPTTATRSAIGVAPSIPPTSTGTRSDLAICGALSLPPVLVSGVGLIAAAARGQQQHKARREQAPHDQASGLQAS